jgi:predicted SAM-dependent methyltransferase
MPIPDGIITAYQAEDVFEHVPYEDLPSVFDEIFRTLKPGGLFRLSVPDYRSDVYFNRSVKDETGALLFDPGGGGSYENGQVVDGGHVWFPVYETVKALFDRSKFSSGGSVNFLHYTDANGSFILNKIDYSKGAVSRTPDFDERVMSPRRPLSIVVDAIKRG